MRNTISRLLICATCSLGLLGAAQQPDNTKVNDKSAPTADQQKNKSDLEMAKNIRRAIVKDKSLSTYGHNVKVIVQNGTATLKGPVHSEDEKKAIEAKAVEVAGATNVRNEITVKEDTADRSKN
jgi:hyperosmotically inducible periplasmic protein